MSLQPHPRPQAKCHSYHRTPKARLWKLPKMMKALEANGAMLGCFDSRPNAARVALPQVSDLEPYPANKVRGARQTKELKTRAPPKPPPDRVQNPPPCKMVTFKHTASRTQVPAVVARSHIVLPSALDLISRVDAQAGGCFAPPLVVKNEQIDSEIPPAEPFTCRPAAKKSENLPPLSSLFSDEPYQSALLGASNRYVRSRGRHSLRHHPYDRMRKHNSDETVVQHGRLSPTPSITSRPSTASTTPSPPATPPPLTPPPSIVNRREPPKLSSACAAFPAVPQSLSNVTRPIPPLALHAGSVHHSVRGHIHWVPFFANPDGSVSQCVAVDDAPRDCDFPGCPGYGYLQDQLSKSASIERKADCTLTHQSTRQMQVHQSEATICATLEQTAVEQKNLRRALLSERATTDKDPRPDDSSERHSHMIYKETPRDLQSPQAATKDIQAFVQGNSAVVVVDIPPEDEPHQRPLKFVMFDPQGSWPYRPRYAKSPPIAG
ncbi:hypothetical protein FKP32DRAFT_1677121 [Trametes sanguinea]|nr:hypothetical protein FKP32DRAFT_1677121 [Trametes sanguinea]